MPKYLDREQAGRILGELMPPLKAAAAVLAIPNGGVVVGAEVARKLGLSLRVIVIRKIQFPGDTESGFGSVAADGSVIYNQPLLSRLDLSREEIIAQTEKARKSVNKRLSEYGAAAQFPQFRDRTAILVDDGLASGVTMEAAVRMVKKYDPAEVVVAVPTASTAASGRIKPLVDKLVCPDIRGGWTFAVADAYENWYDVSAEEVKAILSAFPP